MNRESWRDENGNEAAFYHNDERSRQMSFHECVVRYAQKIHREEYGGVTSNDDSFVDLNVVDDMVAESLHTGHPSPDSDDDVHVFVGGYDNIDAIDDDDDSRGVVYGEYEEIMATPGEACERNSVDAISLTPTAQAISPPRDYVTKRIRWQIVDVRSHPFSERLRDTETDVHARALMKSEISDTRYSMDVDHIRSMWYALDMKCAHLRSGFQQHVVGAQYPCLASKAHSTWQISDVCGIGMLRSWATLHCDVYLSHRTVPDYNSAVVTWIRASQDKSHLRVPITPRDVTRFYEVDGAPLFVFAFGGDVRIYRNKSPQFAKCVLHSNMVLRVSDDYGKLVCSYPTTYDTVVVALRAVKLPMQSGISALAEYSDSMITPKRTHHKVVTSRLFYAPHNK